MISTPAIAALALTAAVSYGLYELKYEVQGLEQRYDDLSRELMNEQDSVHVLKAEWSYLSRPYRVQKLADRFLSLQPTKPAQITHFQDLPLRKLSEDKISGNSKPTDPLLRSVAQEQQP
jgi:hypothetical protein